MPAPSAQKHAPRRDSDQDLKKWAIIGFGTIGVLVGGYFVLNALMTEDRGGRDIVHVPVVDSKPVRKRIVDETPVVLVARPLRLFDEYIKGVHRKDRKALLALSEFDESKLDLLLTDERVKIVTEALQSKRMKMTEEKIDGPNARIAAVFQNGRGFDVMTILLVMRQRSGAEDWVVSRVEDQWFASSGKTPESRTVELGANRAIAAAPLKEINTFGNIPEGEPVQQDWLPGTGETQKAEIERHIRDLFDEKHPAKLSAASAALATIGKNAIPALLNELVNLDVRKDDDVKKGNAIDRTLAVMTDLEMGYDPATFQSAGALPPAQGRLRAIRRWFGWWKKNKDLPLPQRNRPEDR